MPVAKVGAEQNVSTGYARRRRRDTAMDGGSIPPISTDPLSRGGPESRGIPRVSGLCHFRGSAAWPKIRTHARDLTGPSRRLGRADEAAVHARPGDEELLVIEDLESELITAGRANAWIHCVHLHADSLETMHHSDLPYDLSCLR